MYPTYFQTVNAAFNSVLLHQGSRKYVFFPSLVSQTRQISSPADSEKCKECYDLLRKLIIPDSKKLSPKWQSNPEATELVRHSNTMELLSTRTQLAKDKFAVRSSIRVEEDHDFSGKSHEHI